ncbi:MAG: DUF1232 domain-containing protein [Burkholderiaceae bacterium]
MWMLRLRRFVRVMSKGGWMLLWALRDARTPLLVKAGTVAVLAYLISPIDLIPDLPIIGWVDDATLLMVAIPFLLDRLPAAVRTQAQAASERSRWSRWFGGAGLGGRA